MQKIKSPCIKECKLVQGTCSGCRRSVEEISNWSKYSEQEKEIINLRIKKEREDYFWPDLMLPPINLPVLPSARWNNFKKD